MLLTATRGTGPFELGFFKQTGILLMPIYKLWQLEPKEVEPKQIEADKEGVIEFARKALERGNAYVFV